MSPSNTQRIVMDDEMPTRCAKNMMRMDAMEEDIHELKESNVRMWSALDNLSKDVAGIVGQMKVQTLLLGIVATAILGWLLTKV